MAVTTALHALKLLHVPLVALQWNQGSTILEGTAGVMQIEVLLEEDRLVVR